MTDRHRWGQIMGPYGGKRWVPLEDANALVEAAESLNTRYLSALEEIERHHAMPAGEDWEQAYNEVCSIAIEALAPDAGTENDGP